MKKTKAQRHPTSNPPGFQEWDLTALDMLDDQFSALIRTAISDALTIATQDYKCDVYFPAKNDCDDDDDTPEDDGYGNPIPDDPTTIYVAIPIGRSDDNNPRWSFTLTELVDEMIDWHTDFGEEKTIGEEYVRTAKAVRDSLRALAAKIDAKLP